MQKPRQASGALLDDGGSVCVRGCGRRGRDFFFLVYDFFILFLCIYVCKYISYIFVVRGLGQQGKVFFLIIFPAYIRFSSFFLFLIYVYIYRIGVWCEGVGRRGCGLASRRYCLTGVTKAD